MLRSSRVSPHWLLVLVLVLLWACGVGESVSPLSRRPQGAVRQPPRASRWPEADALFRRDPSWLGGDAAVSVRLDAERVLWLFGDSFVAAAGEQVASRSGRRGAVMVRNSAGLQRGMDPTTASMRFVVRDGPASFIPERGRRWYWPQQGIMLDGALTLFTYRLEPAPEAPLGFRYDGWEALRVDDPSGEPERWALRRLRVPDLAPIEMVGVALFEASDHVYAYGVREPGDHAIYVLRWSRADFVAGALMTPELYCGPSMGWARGPPRPVVETGQTEFSVVPGRDGRFAMVHGLGFGAATVALRTAPSPEGPFGEAVEVFTPPERGRRSMLIYGVRAHPEQGGEGLLLTYNANSLDVATLLEDLDLYYPRFVRLWP